MRTKEEIKRVINDLYVAYAIEHDHSIVSEIWALKWVINEDDGYMVDTYEELRKMVSHAEKSAAKAQTN